MTAARYREDPKNCRGFHWIGQPWSSCDNCGRPSDEHAGYWSIREGAGPFDVPDDDAWILKPWEATQ